MDQLDEKEFLLMLSKSSKQEIIDIRKQLFKNKEEATDRIYLLSRFVDHSCKKCKVLLRRAFGKSDITLYQCPKCKNVSGVGSE